MSFLDNKPTRQSLSNGIVLNYVRAGTGPCVIFIHGAMGDWRSWAPQWDAFVSTFDCISYSRRYSFPNPNPMESRSHNALVDADDLLGLMDALRIEKAILVGSSYGGFTALATAAKAPERVQAIVSVEAPMMRYAVDPQVAKDFLGRAAKPARDAFERGETQEGVMLLTGGIVGKKPSEIPAHILERRMQNAEAARSLALSDDEFPMIDRARLRALPMPILLMSGANTAPVHRTIFKGVAETISHARVRIVEGSGHSVSQQQPEAFNHEVLDFLSEATALS